MNIVKRKLNRILDKLLAKVMKRDFYFYQEGFCLCCDQKVVFYSDDNWLRDNFFCSNCSSIPRERALIYFLNQEIPNWKDLTMHESSPENRGASLKFKRDCRKYSASQYFPGHSLGESINGFLNQNLESLTFESNSFDIFVTQDVLEHVFEPAKAFNEIARVLKPGGVHIFTVPLVNKHERSEKWSILTKEGKVQFLKKPEYHGNPVDEAGSPVTMHWGYDIAEFIDKHSDVLTQIKYIDDIEYGIRAEFNEVVVSIKKQDKQSGLIT